PVTDSAQAPSVEERLELLEDSRLGLGALDRLDDLAAHENVHGRDAHDAVAGGHAGVLVGVELDDLDLVTVVPRELLEDRGDGATRAAPRRPEVDEHGALGLED